MKKQTFLLFAAAAMLAMPLAAQADLIVGVDQFRSSTTNLTPANYAVQDGVDVLITRSGTDANGNAATPGVNSAGSTDGSIGSEFDAGVSTAQTSSGESYRWINGAQTARFDFDFTDTSGVGRVLGEFHFDFGRTRPNVTDTFELYLIDGATETLLGSGTNTVHAGAGAPDGDYEDYDVSLGGSGLAFAANSTVTLSLRFSNGSAGGGHHGHLDNVGLSTFTPVPEPTSLAIFGLAGLGLMVRRRK